MGTELPDEMKAEVKGYIEEVWAETQANVVRSAGGAMKRVINQKAVEFFGKMHRTDYGKMFESQRDLFEEHIREALSGGTRREQLQKLKAKLQYDLEDPRISDRIDDVFRNKIYTAQNFSRVEAIYQEDATTEVEIVAVMDVRTSVICRELNGRIMSVKTLYDFQQEFMADEPDGLFWNRWPKPSDRHVLENWVGASTESILADPACRIKSPPYHFRCRTTVVVRTKPTMRRRTKGGTTPVKGEITDPAQPLPRQADLLEKRRSQLVGLRPDELVNKMESLRHMARWRDENLEDHWDEHSGDGIAASKAAYAEKAKGVLKDFDMAYTYLYRTAGGDEIPKFGFLQKQADGRKLFVPVNPDTFEIDSLMEVMDNYEKRYLRIL